MSFEFKDITGQLRSRRDVEDALAFVTREMVLNPLAMSKEGTPVLLHYIVIRDVLRTYLAAISTVEGKQT